MNALKLSNIEDRKLGKILRLQAEAIPDHPFLLADERRFTFRQVNSLANSYAAGLSGLGLEAGGRVVIFMESCPEYVFATFAVNKLGAVWVPVNTDYKGEWLISAFTASRSRILVTDDKLLARVLQLGDQLPFEYVIINGRVEEKDRSAASASLVSVADFEALEDIEGDDAGIHYGDTAAILWTSGTTGAPKGVMQSHNVWITGAQSVANMYGLREGDICYNCVPLYNSAAWVTNIYPSLVCGITCAMDPVFSVSDFWDRCRYYGATTVFTLGAMHMFLWKRPERPDDADNPVRTAMMIPIPEEIKNEFCRRFGIGDGISQGYGQSEVMGLLCRIDDGRKQWKPNSLGEPVPSIELKVLDENDREVEPGTVGEFAVRPREPYAIFNGYFDNTEDTLKSLRNLWYHTGDLGMQDKDGDFFFVDRKQDYIRYKGRNLSSFQVEGVVSKHPGVKEVAAHGIASRELASEAELKIIVVKQDDSSLTEEDLARYINDNAPYFFVPRYIEFVDELPYTPSGKVQKYRLRERGVTPTTWDREKAGFIVIR